MSIERYEINYVKVAINILLVSVLSIVLSIIVYYILDFITNGVGIALGPYPIHGFVKMVIFIQFILVFFIILFSTGMLSIKVNWTFIKDSKSALIVGAITGLTIITILIILLAIMLSRISYFRFDIQLVENLLEIWLGSSLVAILIVSLGSDYYMRHIIGAKQRCIKGIPCIYLNIILISLAILLISLVTMICLYPTGMIDDRLVSKASIDISVNRINYNTISIIYNGNAYISNGRHILTTIDTNRSFSIFINGKEASNSTDIQAGGLNASITPEGGLNSLSGASVIIDGSDIEPKEYNGTRVVIIAYFKDGTKDTVYDRLV